MDENIIFTKPAGSSTPPEPQQPGTPLVPPSQPPPPPLPPEPAQPVQNHEAVNPIVPQVVTPSGEPVLPKPPRTSPFGGGLLKIGGIVVVLIVIIILLLTVVLPIFKGKETEEKVTLTYWGLFEEKRVMDTLIQDFQRQHPTITINYIRKDIKKYRESLVTQISNGNGPDMYRFHNSWVGMMRPYLSPLSSDVMPPDVLKNNYFPVVAHDLVRNGGLYGVPLGIDTLSLFVNTELFDAGGNSVPKTWDEFVSVAKDRVVKDSEGKIKTAGAAMGTYDNITHAPDIVALLMAQNGTNFDNFPSTVENASQALEFYTAFAKSEGSVWDDTLEPSITTFAKGNLAMYFGYSWDIFTIQAMNPELKFSIHPVPNLPGHQTAFASYWAEGVSSKSKYQKEAMLFMQFLAKKESLQKLYSEAAKTRPFGELYPRSDLVDTLKNNQLIYPFVQQASFATSSYFVSDTYDDGGINEQMNAYLGNAVRSTQNSTSAQSAIETLAKGVTQVLGKYGK